MIGGTLPQGMEAVIHHYEELDRLYRAIWGEHVHHGLWLSGDESPVVAVENLVAHVAVLARRTNGEVSTIDRTTQEVVVVRPVPIPQACVQRVPDCGSIEKTR